MAKAKTPEQLAAAELKELQKKAKKLKVQFEKETTAEELKVLVDAAEAAKAAQDAANGPVPPPDSVAGAAPDSGGTEDKEHVSGNQVHAQEAAAKATDSTPVEATTPGGDKLILSHTTKANKELFNLVMTPKGKVQLKNRHGIVLDEFENEAAGKKHMENLSRF